MKPDDLTPGQQADLIRDFGDHATFCRESLQIRNLAGSSVPMELSPGQLKLNALIEKTRKRGKPVRICALKPRRAWFTAGVCAEMFHRIPFFPGQKGLIIADKYKPAGLEAFGYLTHFQKTYRPFSRHEASIKASKLVKDNEQQIAWANGSFIDVLSAEGGDVGRGGGRQFLLCDELAFWRSPEVTLTAVLNMVPKIPESTVIVQSTANGVGGEFYDLCQMAMDPRRDSGWQFLFFSWLEHPGYRTEVPGDKAVFQRSLDADERDLMGMHGASLEQLAWRRWTIGTECRGKVDLFNQEYPCTPEIAFLSSGRPALDRKAISLMISSEGTVGELQELEDYGRKQIQFTPREFGALTIYRKPEPGKLYVMGNDIAGGKDVSQAQRGDDPDWYVSVVLDSTTGDQVAQVRERMRPSVAAQYTYMLGRWYNWAYTVPEVNGVGLGHLDELIRLGYPVERIYRKQRVASDRRSGSIDEIGFVTTTVTKPMLINALDTALIEGSINIRNAVTLRELLTFVIKPNGSMEAQEGAHDDCVIATALAVMGLRTVPRKTVVLPENSRRVAVQYGQKRRRDDDDD